MRIEKETKRAEPILLSRETTFYQGQRNNDLLKYFFSSKLFIILTQTYIFNYLIIFSLSKILLKFKIFTILFSKKFQKKKFENSLNVNDC